MTIEEKAKEIIPDAFDDDIILPAREGFIVKQQRLYFKVGAEWMLEKAVQRFANEVSEFDTLLYLIDKTSEGLINKENTVEKFRKALEE